MTWLGGLLRRRPGRVLGAVIGTALAVALLASLGAFLSSAMQGMTDHAVASVPVDWQVEVQPGADATAVARRVRTDPRVARTAVVEVGRTAGLEASVGGTTQTTGPGVVLGLPDGYRTSFPGEIRTLAGRGTGVLVAQQTAANLHVGPGDVVAIGRAGLPPAGVRVDGVIDLPQANSLFQTVGAPPGAQPTAPPDNVVLLPVAAWRAAFAPLLQVRPDLGRTQIHARLDRTSLPADPAAAFNAVSGAARHLEADLAGTGLVGDNLAATLDAARSDALYAEVLFVLLGLPAVVLAGLLTATVAGAGRERRRRDFALLRTRGATTRLLRRIAIAEAALVAAVGGVVGLGIGLAVGHAAFGSATFGATTASAVVWALGAVAVGGVIAAAAVYAPARRDARDAVIASRADVGPPRRPLALRLGVDVWTLVAGALVVWATSRGGYSVVLAPEGVPTVAVSYWALAGPFLLWLGVALGGWRIADALARRPAAVRRLVTPLGGGLSGLIASSLARRHRQLATASVLLALSVGFGASTSVFNATYRHQVGVDAVLTNGADVTVTEPPATAAPAARAARLAQVPGVHHVEPVVHRFAYVGSDLQDLYGVDPVTFAKAGRLQDAYVSGGSAAGLLAELARHPDAVLVSAETVHDFQLRPGDLLRLRLPDPRSGTPVEVPFHYAGIVKEFPTAPSDSFLVTNARYVAQRTGDASVGTYLVDARGAPPATVAARVRKVVGPGATVTDIQTSRRVIGSSLTAVDLRGLTRVELAFALLLAAAAGGLVLALGLAERRRSFAIVSALGARRAQVGAFVRAEALTTTVAGLVLGAATGWLLAAVLVKVLTGVFDPPPSHLFVPWAYLTGLGGCVVAAVAVAAETVRRLVSRPTLETLRDL